MKTIILLLTASAAALVLLALPPAAQAQSTHGASSDRQYHRMSDRACHHGMSH